MMKKPPSSSRQGAGRFRHRRPAKTQPKRLPVLSSELVSSFNYALTLHRAGHMSEAEEMYRQILRGQPRHFDSLHLLGVVYHQRGEHARAAEQIEAALKINPNDAFAHSNRGGALAQMRSFSDAVASYNKAVALKPDFAEAFHSRGNALLE